jgi:large subunit ribosomal protein L9
MKVILTMDVDDLGRRGDRVEVAAGFARNYLIPRRLAVTDTRGNARAMAEESKLTDVRERKAKHEAEKVGSWLKEHEIFTTLKIGREGKAFGAVTSKDLAVLLRQAGLEVDRRRIRLDAPIKRLGVFDVPLAVHADVPTSIRVYVDRDGGSKDGASAQQAEHDARLQAEAEAAKAEAEARAAREAEAEEAARLAIERAAARKAREEEEARAREEARAAKDVSAEESDEAAASGDEMPTAGDEPASAEKAGENA